MKNLEEYEKSVGKFWKEFKRLWVGKFLKFPIFTIVSCITARFFPNVQKRPLLSCTLSVEYNYTAEILMIVFFDKILDQGLFNLKFKKNENLFYCTVKL